MRLLTRSYEMLFRLPWLGYRGTVILFAALSSIGPWVLVGLLAGAGLGQPPLLGMVGAFVLWVIALVAVAALLHPVLCAADALSELGMPGRAAKLPRDLGGEIGALLSGIAEVTSRVDGLHHRWVQRHPVTALPTREFLLLQMAGDLDNVETQMVLGAIRFADYDRLAGFDGLSADLALKAFAERLSTIIGKDRPLAHVDRDCFAIWFRELAPSQAVAELQAICYALGTEISAGEIRLVPEIEAGTASYPSDSKEPAGLVARALGSLAKPGRTVAANVDFITSSARAKELFALEQDLRHAVEREELQLHFQPVVDLAKHRLVGAEALLRWQHPRLGAISPARFVPILEDAGLTNEIGMWTLNAACREARNWQRHGLEGLKVAVNLSATQVHDSNLRQMIARTLERHKLHAQSLELELTETAATEDAERTFSLFGELRAMGVSLAIDDFGSGYSSLSYVKNLPFDKLKIDREFVVRVHERRDSQAICRSLIELTRGLGIKLLAEGVELAEEVRLLRSFGCTLFQGYYFSRPLTAKKFIDRAMSTEWPELLIGHSGAPSGLTKRRIPA